MSDSKKTGNKQRSIAQLAIALVVISCMQLSGCADTQSQGSSDEPQSMGGQGQGQGSGMGQGPPPDGMNNRNNVKQEQKISEEAFAACEGKSEGDIVMLITGKDEKVKATCRDINDHLVALPEVTKEREQERPQRR
ncbi:MAG: hypothetical protein ACI8ZB_004713 [Desulforhopalus sp.]|jgi:hypothetical protein